jgi:uncharacterized protein (TIGR03118 family)
LAGAALAPGLQGQDAAASSGYVRTDLVSDVAGQAAHTDAHLVNPWGLAYIGSPVNGPFWASDNASGYSTLYDGAGAPQSTVVTVPAPAVNPSGAPGSPTGIVANSNSGAGAFPVSEGTATGPSLFIFATEDGLIAGWDPAVDANNAIVAVDNSGADGKGTNAVYKGLALLGSNLYATDFRNGYVEVFGPAFNHLATFSDSTLTALGYAPFGIATISGDLYVTFAEQDAAKHDDVPGAGHGYLDVFTATGNLVTRLSGPEFNSPWGLALAPSSGFGQFSGDLLVGNFGDGTVNALDPNSGQPLGKLSDAGGNPIVIDGLWGLLFGNGGSAGPTTSLYFSAGPGAETHGLFGSIAVAGPSSSVAESPWLPLLPAVALVVTAIIWRQRRR